MSGDLPRLVVLLGPTGVGKTALSLALARDHAGEIVSADSRQIYRGMDIGTAKATPAEQAVVPHHLIDIADPDQTITVADYQARATAAITQILQRGGTPFLVGGTALYLRAVTLGLRIPTVPPNAKLRAQLEETLADEGLQPLVDQLLSLDPGAAQTVDLRNPRRVLRALEIVRITGRAKSELEGASPPPWRITTIGLTRSRASLYQRIDDRVNAMIEGGLVEETQRLLARYDPALPALSSLGYREIGACLRGEWTLSEATQRIMLETHRYVRQQETWFRKMADVHWFDLDAAPVDTVRHQVDALLR